MKYITKPGDQWDMIAKECYGNELLAGNIMQANPDYLGIYQFDYGTELTIPELQEDDIDGLPPWRD